MSEQSEAAKLTTTKCNETTTILVSTQESRNHQTYKKRKESKMGTVKEETVIN
jgi:hypothetical protein